MVLKLLKAETEKETLPRNNDFTVCITNFYA